MAGRREPRLAAAVGLLLPARCPSCRGPRRREVELCEGCSMHLAELPVPAFSRVPGVDAAWSAAPHSGPARDLVGALKFGRRLGAAGPIADRIAGPLPSSLAIGPLVPVPSEPGRGRRRGFNPAAEIAAALAVRASLPGPVDCLRRERGGRQVGRRRGQRRSASLGIAAGGPVPPRCLLVDDVLTTGATLTACAIALRDAGALAVNAVAFTRRD